MDFKFKEVVEESIIYFYDNVLSCNEYTEDVFEELNHVYAQAPKADEYEAKNKELLEELKYLNKVNDDLVWQRDTDEEHESKAKAWDLLKLKLDGKNKSILSNPKASDEDLDFVGNNTAVLWEMSDLEMKFRREKESGEPNEL